MRDGKDRKTEILPESMPEAHGPTTPPKVPHDTPPIEVTYKVLKNCGDCEPGGFGSTYGHGPV